MTNAKVNILPERLWKHVGSILYFGVNCSRRWVFCISSIEYWQTPLYGHSFNKAPHDGHSALTLFEITGDPRNLIGSQQCDLDTNHTIFCSKSHLFRVVHVLNRIISALNRTIFVLYRIISVSNIKWDLKAFLFRLFKKPATWAIIY